MAKIAILGFGTVGSGVYEVLCRNAAGVSRRAGEPVAIINSFQSICSKLKSSILHLISCFESIFIPIFAYT